MKILRLVNFLLLVTFATSSNYTRLKLKHEKSNHDRKMSTRIKSESSYFSQMSTWYLARSRYLAVTALTNNSLTDTLLSTLTARLQVPITLYTVDTSSNHTIDDNVAEYNINYSEINVAYVIVAQHDVIVMRHFNHIKEIQRAWNPRANFLILYMVSNCQPIPESRYRTIFQDMWFQRHILNVLVMTMYNCNKTTEALYYDPFVHDKDMNGSVVSCVRTTVANCKVVLTDRLADMNGYPIRISMFERNYSAIFYRSKTTFGTASGIASVTTSDGSGTDTYYGSDGYALSVLSSYMRFTPVIREPTDGEQYGYYNNKSGKFVGAIGDIIYDRADVAFNTRFIKDYNTEDVVFAYQLSSDELCILVPKAKLVPKWLAMLTSFNRNLYLSIIGMYLLLVVLWYLFKRFRWRYGGVRNINVGLLFVDMFQPFVIVSLGRLPLITAERVLMMCCILFGFLIASIFQGKLLTAITKPSYFRDIETLEQLDAAGLSITTGSASLLDTFDAGSDNPVMTRLKARTRLNWTGSVFDRVSNYSTFAGITRKSDLMMKLTTYLTPDETPLLNYVKECPRSYYLSFMLPKQSAYLSKINAFNSRIFEAGLVEYWERRTTFEVVHAPQEGNGTRGRAAGSPLRVFTVHDLQLPFFVLVIGLASGTAAFVAEVAVKLVMWTLSPKPRARKVVEFLK